MFETLTAAQPDKILALMALFRDDPRPGKVDLGVGVYSDDRGRLPVLQRGTSRLVGIITRSDLLKAQRRRIQEVPAPPTVTLPFLKLQKT